MHSLHKLPNGTWIDLTQIVAIRVLAETACNITGAKYDERVAIHWGESHMEMVTPEDPMAFCKDLAALVNAARQS